MPTHTTANTGSRRPRSGVLGSKSRRRRPMNEHKFLKSRGWRAHTGAMTVIALVLGALLVLVQVSNRVSFPLRGETLPATNASPVAQPAPASFACALPVNTISSTGDPSLGFTMSAGFVNIPSGEFRADPAATLQDLPS